MFLFLLKNLARQGLSKTSWVSENAGLGHGLFPDGTKPLPQAMLFYFHWNPQEHNWGKLKVSFIKTFGHEIYGKILFWEMQIFIQANFIIGMPRFIKAMFINFSIKKIFILQK